MSSDGAPSPRGRPFAAYTAAGHMLVFGGHRRANGAVRYLTDGALYDPRADRWAPLETDGAPPADGTVYHATLARGVLIVWTDGLAAMWRYDLVAARWAPVSRTGSPPQSTHSPYVVGGSDGLLVFGGVEATGGGWTYDPVEDRWRDAGLREVPRECGGTVVDTEAFVFVAGCSTGGFYSSRAGFIVDKASRRVRMIKPRAAPRLRTNPGAVWTGTEVVVWGGHSLLAQPYGDGASYDPRKDRWRALPRDGGPTPRSSPTMVWARTSVVVWGGGGPYDGLEAGGALYDPTTRAWDCSLPRGASVRAERVGGGAVWDGERVLLFGGFDADRNEVANGVRLRPPDPAPRTRPR